MRFQVNCLLSFDRLSGYPKTMGTAKAMALKLKALKFICLSPTKNFYVYHDTLYNTLRH